MALFDLPTDSILALGQIALGLQAIGFVTLLIIVFQIVSFYLNWKRMKVLRQVQIDMKRIEGRIEDVLLKVSLMHMQTESKKRK